MYQTRIKWAELWFRALGYNDDYFEYCCDLREKEPVADKQLVSDNPRIPLLYDFFGDVFLFLSEEYDSCDVSDWEYAFSQWLNVNKHKILPIDDFGFICSIGNEQLKNRLFNSRAVLSEILNQPELDLYMVDNWDSDNNIQSIEKQLDIFHWRFISRSKKITTTKLAANSTKPCWASVSNKAKELSAQNNQFNSIDEIPLMELRSIYDNQIKQLQTDIYSIVQSSITDRFPTSKCDF